MKIILMCIIFQQLCLKEKPNKWPKKKKKKSQISEELRSVLLKALSALKCKVQSASACLIDVKQTFKKKKIINVQFNNQVIN